MLGKQRDLKARFSEHRRPSTTTSRVSGHINIDYPGHMIDLEKTKILTVEPNWFERRVKEAIYIRIKSATSGPKLSKSWKQREIVQFPEIPESVN